MNGGGLACLCSMSNQLSNGLSVSQSKKKLMANTTVNQSQQQLTLKAYC